MSGGDDDRRRERKYPLSAAGLLEFRWWHRSHGAAFARRYAPRVVHNIYFESPEWDSYGDNMGGVSDRSKCRLRWYGETETAEVVTFEVKRRRNGAGDKRQERISMSELQLWSLPVQRLYIRLRPLLPPELRLRLDRSHQPVLYGRFRREYYEAPEGLRMTVDTDIVYASLLGNARAGRRLLPGETAAVVEFKFALPRRPEAEAALDRLPFRATRFSKYVGGVDILFPH